MQPLKSCSIDDFGNQSGFADTCFSPHVCYSHCTGLRLVGEPEQLGERCVSSHEGGIANCAIARRGNAFCDSAAKAQRCLARLRLVVTDVLDVAIEEIKSLGFRAA